MQEVKVISAAEETDLLEEWFETVHFDKESEGIPPLEPERDDEESRNRSDAGYITDWLLSPLGTEIPASDYGDYLVSENFQAWDFVDYSVTSMSPQAARDYMTGEARFQLLYGENRGNPNHSKKNGQFTKGGGGSASPKASLSGSQASTEAPVKGSDQSKWAEDVSRDMNNDPLAYKGDSWNTPIATPLVAIGHQQGYDGLPHKGSVDDAIAAGGLEIHRGIIPHEKSGTSAESIRDKMTSGAYEPGKGGYGNGYYFSTSPGIAKMYANAPIMDHGYNAKAVAGGVTVRAALHKDAKIVDYDTLKKEHLAWNLAQREKVHWNAFETDFQVPEGKISPELINEINDPGHFAALMGYDAIRVPLKDRATDRKNKARIKKKIGSDDLGDEIVVLNRTALVVE